MRLSKWPLSGPLVKMFKDIIWSLLCENVGFLQQKQSFVWTLSEMFVKPLIIVLLWSLYTTTFAPYIQTFSIYKYRNRRNKPDIDFWKSPMARRLHREVNVSEPAGGIFR